MKVLGYTVGTTYHDSYWHADFTVLGATDSGQVSTRKLGDDERIVNHRTPFDRRFHIAPGNCRTNGCPSNRD